MFQEVLDEEHVQWNVEITAGRGHVSEDEGWNGSNEALFCHGCSFWRLF
jgi:hypothetical protein